MNKKNTTKKEISMKIKQEMGLPDLVSKKIVDDFIEILKYKIKMQNLILKNVGTFKIIKKKERIGRNPKTKKEYIISERNSLSFNCSKNLTNLLNE